MDAFVVVAAASRWARLGDSVSTRSSWRMDDVYSARSPVMDDTACWIKNVMMGLGFWSETQKKYLLVIQRYYA